MSDAQISTLRALFFATIAAGTAMWGWIGWLVWVLVFCMVLDYATGSWAAMKAGLWSSKAAREGLWHKGGMMVIVLIAVIADVLIGLMIQMNSIPFQYKVLLSPVVIAWYCFTELGSSMENAAQMGAKAPGFMRKALELAGRIATQAGEVAVQQATQAGGATDENSDSNAEDAAQQAGEAEQEEDKEART